MYWSDYSPRSRRRPGWGRALLLGLLLGLLGVALLHGWWRFLLPDGRVGADASEHSVLPTPILLTQTPEIALIIGVTPSPAPADLDTKSPVTVAVETVELNAPAPTFTLPDLFDEQTTYTLSEYRDQPVVLNFWASWCVPCRREMPALQATAARYEAEGLLLLGMNQTYTDNLEEARAFVKELELTFPQTRDDSGAVGAEAYRVTGIPTTVFINRDGKVVHIQIGEMSLEQITMFTERLIAGQPLQP